jgi:hypothetical protein
VAPLRVFITGASSGLGRALTRAYAGRGAVLGLLSRRETELIEIARGLGTPCATYPADVRDAGAVSRAAADFLMRYGGADVVIANAGVSIGTLSDAADDLFVLEETLAVNVIGMANTLQPFIQPMRDARAGKLVGIASVAGYRGLPGSGAYCASKAAAISYLESTRVELARTGVRVITVSPGYIATPMTESNPYAMPFLMTAEDAARRLMRIVDAGRSYAVVPWQMAVVARLLRLLPEGLFDRIFAHAPRKPRRRSATTRP